MITQKKILYLYKTPRKKIYSEWKSGIGSDTALYGANHLEKLGHKVDFFDIGFSKLNPFWWFAYPFHFIFAKATGIGFNLSQTISLFLIFNKYDLIISTMDSAGLPLLILKKLKLLDKPLIYISVDFINRTEENKNNRLLVKFKDYLQYADAIVCYSRAEQKSLKKINKNTYFISVGTDVDYYKKNNNIRLVKNKKPVILTFGRDKDRDFQTFVSAIKKTNYLGKIVTSPANLKALKIPENIKVMYDLSPEELKKEIYSSAAIVIPIKNISRAAGQLSLLDSLACKKPVIVSNIPAISKTYNFKNNRDCLYTKPEDSSDLTMKIKRLVENKKQSKRISANGYKTVQQYSTKNFAHQLLSVIETD